MRKRPPNGYREDLEFQAAYEEGGRSIGRAIMWDKSQEVYFWNLLKGIDLWPRWYLVAFKNVYSTENPTEYRRARARRYSKRLAKEKTRATLEGVRQKANDSKLFQDGR